MPGNLSEQINDYLDSMEDRVIDPIAKALLISAAETMDSYRFIISRSVFTNNDMMKQIEHWAPNHYSNLMSDA